MENKQDKIMPPIIIPYWQGGERYENNISEDGTTLQFPFTGPALYCGKIWEQLTPDIKLKPVDFNNYFDKNLPLNFEIGIGNGEFLCRCAKENSQENWLGCEVFKKSFSQSEKRILRERLSNVKIIQFDAYLLLRLIPDGTLNSVYVNFPDPWPKSHHKRRRLLKTPFINLISLKLKKRGILHIATDHDDYAEEICANIKDAENLSSLFDEPYIKTCDNNFQTKFYKKFAGESGAYYFKYEKI